MDKYAEMRQALSNLYREAARNKTQVGPSLCLQCANIVPSPARGTGCEWSVSDRPVPGWTAIECEFRISPDNIQTSYCVKQCPKYIPYKLVYRTNDT